MNTKKIISLTLIGAIVLLMSCTQQDYYKIPRDANGNVVITGVSKATSNGISTLDDKFTVDVTFPNAKSGDIMKTELLQLQVPAAGGSAQLLPLAGTQKDVTVGADLKTSVTYNRSEAKLNIVGDFVTVTFSGKTDANLLRVDLKNATTVSGPTFGGKAVDVVRIADTASFDLSVTPKLGAYAGTVTVKRKNGINAPWISVGTGSYSSLAKVPISGTDFAAGRDTMYYSFVANQGTYADSVTKLIVITDPFFLKKSGTLSLATAAQGGMNIITNTSVSANDANAILAVSAGSLTIKAGASLANGKSIKFVPSTNDLYYKNNSANTIAAYESGAPVSEADPAKGDGVYIFKLIIGPLPADILYGMIKVTRIVPAASVDYEYRIGNVYAHLSIIK